MGDYESIWEIFPDDKEQEFPVAPLADWENEVLERGLSVDFGDIGGGEPFVPDATVRVTEENGRSWTDLRSVE